MNTPQLLNRNLPPAKWLMVLVAFCGLVGVGRLFAATTIVNFNPTTQIASSATLSGTTNGAMVGSDWRTKRAFNETTVLNPLSVSYQNVDGTVNTKTFYGGEEGIWFGASSGNTLNDSTRYCVRAAGGSPISMSSLANASGSSAHHGLVVWLAADFKNMTSGTQRAVLDSTSVFTLNPASADTGATIPTYRFVVKQGGHYYVSSWNTSAAGAQSLTGPAANTTWAPYDPVADLNFNQSGTFSSMTFYNVQAVGYYFEIDSMAATVSSGSRVSGISFTATIADKVTQLAYKTLPSAPAKDGPFSVTVEARDPSGNAGPVLSDTTITLSKGASGSGTVGGTLTGTIPAGSSSVTISGATYSGSDTMMLTATASGGETLAATSSYLTFASAMIATKLVITSTAVSVRAGVESGNITVERQDGSGNAITTDDPITLTMSSTSTGTTIFNPASPQIAKGFSSVTFTYTDTKTGTPTIRAHRESLTDATQGETVAAAEASQLAFTTQPGGGTGGTAWTTQPKVTVLDAYGNTVTGTSQNVTLAIQNNAGPGGTLSGTATVPVDTGTGVATFSGLKIDKAGTGYTLTATGSSVSTIPSVVISSVFNVTVGLAAKLAFTTQPGGGAGGTAWPIQPQVTLQDAGGNTVSGTSQNVTLAIQNNAGLGGTLSGTTMVAVNTGTGVAIFSGLKIDKAGTGYTLTATGSTVGITPGVVVSSGFDITAGSAAKLVFKTQPGGGTGGTTWSTQPVLTLQDASGNTVTGTSQTVTLAIQNNAGPGGTLSGTATVAMDTGTGVATFSGLSIDKAGTGYTLTAKGSTVNTSFGTVVSSAFSVTVGPAVKLGFTTQPGGGRSGIAWDTQPAVALQDAGGNTATGTSQSVTLGIQNNADAGMLNGTKTLTVNTGTGLANFSGLSIDKAGGGYTLTATGDTLSTTPGMVVSSAFNITMPTISVNYDLVPSTTPALAPTDLAGVVPAANWNNVSSAGSGGFTAPVQTFYDSAGGSVSPFTVTLSTASANSFNTAGNPNQVIYGDWTVNGGGTVNLSGIPYSHYDLYVYFNGSGGVNVTDFKIDGNTQRLTDASYTPSGFTSFVEGTDYVRFRDLTGSSKTMTVTGVSGNNHGVAAFQIVQFYVPCDAATADAGPDQMVPVMTTSVMLAGAVGGGATGGTWSGGAGGFSPNANTLNALYTPTAGEKSARQVTLTLTTSGASQCAAVEDAVTIIFNSPPTASDITMGGLSGEPATLQIIGGKHAPTDADNDTLTITATSEAAHGTVSIGADGANATYTSANTFTGSDSFTYTVSDSHGGAATKTVTVTVAANGPGFNLLSGPTNNGNNTATINYMGIPGYHYALESAPSLESLPITWTPLLTNTVGADGHLSFTFGTSAGQSFFRTRFVGEP